MLNLNHCISVLNPVFNPFPCTFYLTLISPLFSKSAQEINSHNRPFYRYGGHIEFNRLKEYYGMPRGHSLSIYAGFSGKKRTSLYILQPMENYTHEEGQSGLLQIFWVAGRVPQAASLAAVLSSATWHRMDRVRIPINKNSVSWRSCDTAV